MAQVGRVATAALAEMLRSDDGVPASVAQMANYEEFELAPLTAAQIVTQNINVELAEKTSGLKYPLLYVYCEKLSNRQTEKFRRFSGKAQMVMEIRVSQDRMEGLEDKLQTYVDAVTEVLDGRRGQWSEGLYYGGGYEVTFGPVKHGGRNLLQAARVSVELDVSMG